MHWAKEIGLKYVYDHQPGFSRRRVGKRGFVYLDCNKAKVSDENIIQRIKNLVIPPAWEDVWICKLTNGHLQATGRDQRGRKQYRYHEKWTRSRNENKFEKLKAFGECLPCLRERVEADLRLPGYSKEKVLAAVVKVMELTRIRVGNDIYAQENESYGLTTMLNEHAQVRGAKVKLKFHGKSGIEHQIAFSDPRLSRVIRKCQELPGEELFAFEDENGQVHDIGSADVNEYLHRISGSDITAKDFRTWGGTVKAIELLTHLQPEESLTKAQRKKREVQIIRETAQYLGNTLAVCRKYYVHPQVFEADVKGHLHELHRKAKRRKGGPLTIEEQILLELL